MKKILNNYEAEEKNRHYRGYIEEYKRCEKMMEERAKNGKTSCIFPVLLSHDYFPQWDYIKLINIITDKLRENGFDVKVHKPNFIIINWKKNKIDDEFFLADKEKYFLELKKTEEFMKKNGLH
jgi:hypothetical protein